MLLHCHGVAAALTTSLPVLQDKAQQSERLLAEMAAQMQQLRVEKEELQGRNLLLEDLLKVQQQQQHDSHGARRLHASQVNTLNQSLTMLCGAHSLLANSRSQAELVLWCPSV